MVHQQILKVGNPEYFYSQSSTLPYQRPNAFYIGILVSIKLCSSFAIFLLANFINTKLSHTVPWIASARYVPSGAFYLFGPVIQVGTCIQMGSGLIFMILLNVFKQNTLPRIDKEEFRFYKDSYWVRLLGYCSFSTILLGVRIGGLQLCGPFRTVFIGSYYDVTLAGLFGALIWGSNKSKWIWQGFALFAIGIAFEYVFDYSHLDHPGEPWHLYTNWIGLSMLLLSAFCKFGFNSLSFSRNLAKASGGPVQLHAVSSFVSGVILLILSVIELMSSGDMIFFHVLPLSFIVIFGFVLDFYVDTILVTKMEPRIVARVGTTASFFSAFIFAMVLSRTDTQAAAPGLMSLLSFALIYIATFCLTAPGNPIDRTVFAFSSDGSGLPLFNSANESSSAIAQVDLSSQNSDSHASVFVT